MAATDTFMADFDLRIKGGTVVDGTRAPRYKADVWIRDGKIARIGGQAAGFAKRVIEADGLIVAPLIRRAKAQCCLTLP